MPRTYTIELSDPIVSILDETLARVREVSQDIIAGGKTDEVLTKALASTDEEFIVNLLSNAIGDMAMQLIKTLKGSESCDCPSCQLEQEMKSGSDMGDITITVMSASADISQFN